MKAAIITSIYKGDKFINHFLEQITRQTIFNECELILINANSPDREFEIINGFLEDYPNIKYIKLEQDPGLYACWNLAIESSTAPYITNANLDDIKAPWCIEEQVLMLDNNNDIDMVYGETLETDTPLETFERNTALKIFPCLDHSLENLLKVNSPHSSPMWRRSIHQKFGHFNTDYKYCADYEFWLRAAHKGSTFKKINSKLSLYYRNPEGLSSKKENIDPALKEIEKIKKIYYHH